MSALQCCELLAKSQVFQKQASTSAEESKNRAKKKSHGIDHAGGGIPFRLWTATSHPVEIKGGQNFGERQGPQVQSRGTHLRFQELSATPEVLIGMCLLSPSGAASLVIGSISLG